MPRPLAPIEGRSGAYALDPDLPLRSGQQQTAVGQALNPNPVRGPFSTAMAGDVGGSLEPLMESAALFRLDREAAAAILSRTQAAVVGWADVARGMGIASAEIAAMAPAFAAASDEHVLRHLD